MTNALSPFRFDALSQFHQPLTDKANFKWSALYLRLSQADVETCLVDLGSGPRGLNTGQAQERLKQFGPNQVAKEKRVPWVVQLLKTFWNPFCILLSALGVLSYSTGDHAGGLIILVMVLFSVLLTFFQEHRSSLAAEKLSAMVTTGAEVLRDDGSASSTGGCREVPMATLVPGDLVHLSAGDMVPADLRVLSSKDLFVSQSTLTGEAMPIEKHASPGTDAPRGLLEPQNLCFMGSNVVSGTAQAVVIRTGADSYLGFLAQNIVGQHQPTAFDLGINRFTWLMIRFVAVMAPLVFLINGLSKGNWMEAFLFALAVAVGLTPEMLPMIVSVNLAKGALKMSKKKVVVKRLNSIQNFGAMDILCTDKTGTLTEDKVVLERYMDPNGQERPVVLEYAYLNSFYQTGLKNLLDQAVLAHSEVGQALKVDSDYHKIDEIPFDFNRRRMSVVVERPDKQKVLICKGALEEVFNICTTSEVDGADVAFDTSLQGAIHQRARALNEDGLRVVAVAYKLLQPGDEPFTVEDECGLNLVGFVAFLDPPKESANKAIQALGKHGVQVKVLTGDNELVTGKVCRTVGLQAERILLGRDIDAMDDAALAAEVEKVSVFAKLDPAQKKRIIHSLQAGGHVVGFMGDGINDAPALRTADVGISVDNAVDIAKESADIILLEKNLLVLVDGALEGRNVFGNIVKYIKMGASSNFGNMFSMLGASMLLPFLPMLPVQILLQNLLYDFSQTAIPFDHVDDDYLLKPRRWEILDIERFMLVIGPVSSIFDYATFALLWWVFAANSPSKQALFQSGWFVEGLLSQALIVHLIRTRKIPFVESWAAWPLSAATGLVVVVGLWIPFSRLAPHLGFQSLPGAFFGWLVVILICYALLTQQVKSWFISKYGFN